MANNRFNKQVTPKGYKMGGRVKKMGGGSLKPVDKEKNPGLSKLPTEVRNKMGFMKKGGRVGKKFGGGADSGRIGQLKSDLKTAKNTTEKRTALKKADKDRNKFKVK